MSEAQNVPGLHAATTSDDTGGQTTAELVLIVQLATVTQRAVEEEGRRVMSDPCSSS
jgi:hypothetical protein